MRVVIKVGTQSILFESGAPMVDTMQNLVNQIAQIQKNGHQTIFVSSGAVGFGRKIAHEHLQKEYGSSIAEKQLLASLGQHELMRIYSQMFLKHGLVTSQLLLTKQDFYTRKNYLNIARLFQELLKHRQIIPVINENDSVAIEELMFTDNDELAGLIAAQMNADKLIILSNVEGVYTGHPDEATSTLIDIIDPNKGWPHMSSAKSTHGRGGMISKLKNARKMSQLGIVTHIASIKQPHVIRRIVQDEPVGTKILSYYKKSNIKKWIAYSVPVGKIFINEPFYKILKNNKRIVSILPIGIESYSGEFKKGDVVEILGPSQDTVGIGVVKYDAKKLSASLGQKNKPIFIHYDYLYIF